MTITLFIFNCFLSYLAFALTYALALTWFRFIDQPHRRRGA